MMKQSFGTILILFVAPAIIYACSNKVSNQQNDTNDAVNQTQAKLDKFAARYDSVFDVHGPVKSVTFTVSSNPNLWQLDYIVSKVEYLPRGNKWNIKGNQNYELNYFKIDEKQNFICDFVDEQDLNVSIDYSFNPKTHRYDERTIQVAPEYDGCDLLYIYNEKDSVVSAEFIDFIWNSEKNGFDEKKSVLKVKDEGIDEYGNWTVRNLSNSNMSIIIKRTFDYFTVDEIPEDNLVFDGDSIKVNETVGDFNGDGVIEKAWVNLAELGDDDPRFYEPVDIKLSFSDPQISSVTLGEAYGFRLFNIGDINGDGCDDIGMIPYPSTSDCTLFDVWVSEKGINWHKLLTCSIYLESLFDNNGEVFIPVRRGNNGIIEYFTVGRDGLVILSQYKEE